MSCEEPSAFFLSKIQLRFLSVNDADELKSLCRDWFPIEYPDGWYKEVTSNPKFFSLVATYKNKIIGVLIAEVKFKYLCNKEDSSILGFWYPVDTQVAYILILGVVKDFRRRGVASLLLDTFLSQVTSADYKKCKAVYLHVLSSNTNALKFYEHRHFRRHRLLPRYYAINGVRMDGFCYVSYINGGEPPWTALDLFRFVCRGVFNCKAWQLSAYVLSRLCVLPRVCGQNDVKGVRDM